MTALETPDGTLEDVEQFRERAREWIRAELRAVGPDDLAGFMRGVSDERELAAVAHERAVQRKLFDAGLAGICVPVEYGGQGLTPAHQAALNEELKGYEYPTRLQSPTMSPCLAVLLDFGTEEQKREHVPAILRGEEIWGQFLSEPSGGSDVAGALTTAVRDGDEWVLNGSKIWTSGAWWTDWALCLARTNWDVPKHRGLTVFMFAIHQPGVELHRIEMLNGNREFCQEFMTDLRVPDSQRVGDVDQGWTVGTRWMFHERMAMAHNSPLLTEPPTGRRRLADARGLVSVAGELGRVDDPYVRDLIGEAHMLELASTHLQPRLGAAMARGIMSEQAASIGRLFGGVVAGRTATIAFEIAGAEGGVWSESDGAVVGAGTGFLVRQIAAIGGGTLEMARNVIAERVLGMPREQSGDRDVPFRDVPRGPSHA